MSDYSRGDYADLPAGTTDLENNYTAPDLTAIASNDNSTYAEQTANNEIAIHQYKKTVTSQYTNILWSGKSSLAPSESPVIMEVYNVDGTAWEELDRDDSTAADTDFDLSYNNLATADYLDTGVMTWRVWQEAAIGESWVGVNWTLGPITFSPNPATDAELWETDAAQFTSGVYGWVPYGTNTVENDAGTLKITVVDHGNGAYNYLRATSDLTSNLTVGRYYKISCQFKISSGSARFETEDGVVDIAYGTLTNTEFVTVSMIMRAQHATLCFLRFLNALNEGQIVWLDNMSCLPLVHSNLFCVNDYGSQKAFSANMTLPDGYFGGVVARYSDSNNYVLAWHDKSTVWLDMVIGGVITNKVSVGVAYVAGAAIEIRWASADSAQLYYNGTQRGTNQDVSTVPAGNYAGMVGTGTGVQFTSPTAS